MSDGRFTEIWKSLSRKQRKIVVASCVRGGQTNRAWDMNAAGVCSVFASRKELKTFITWTKKVGCSRELSKDEIHAILDRHTQRVDRIVLEEVAQTTEPEQEPDPLGRQMDSCYYNDTRDEYVLDLSFNKGATIVPGEKVRALQRAYSNLGGGRTVNEMADQFGYDRSQIVEILRKLGVTHDSLPFTNEVIAETSEDELVKSVVAMKRGRIRNKARKRDFIATQREADAFRAAQYHAEALSFHIEATGPAYRPPVVSLDTVPVEPWTLVVPLADLHWGKWGPDRSGNAYDRVKARARLLDVTNRSIARIAHRGRPEVVHLVLLGDCLHIDNIAGTTTRGTQQLTDGDPELLVTSWFDVIREWVDMWRGVGEVVLTVIPGNHDRLLTAALRAGLRGWFATAEDVVVKESLSHRQYIRIGDSLVMALHGDTKKPRDWVEMMAREAAADWGATRHRYILHGHFHTLASVGTYSGTEVIGCPSLSGSCVWEYTQGYPPAPETLLLCFADGLISREVVRAR